LFDEFLFFSLLGENSMSKLLSGSFCAALTFIALTGCGTPKAPAPVTETKVEGQSKEHDHSGYWCKEHGVPEEVCGLCNSKLAAEFQKKGDWCKEHDRPDSQCFICHPEKEGEFAALYEAKFGEKPPKATE
jgi:hypothetical protein